MLSTTTIPTTARWYGREFGDYYFYDGGPESGWDTKIENYVDDVTKQKTIEKSKAIDYTVSIIGAVLNIVHFIILSRKDLRVNVIFIIMIGICISDLLSFSANIAETTYGNSYARGFLGGFCGTSRQYWETWIEFVAKEIQLFGRLESAVLALIMAMIRTLSVMFPMSRWVEKMTEPIFGIMVVLVSSLICFVRYLLHFLSFEIENSTGFMNGCVNAWAKYDGLPAHLEGTTAVVLTGFYVVTTVALIVALRIVKKRRKNLKTGKSDNTTLLVILMAVSFLFSELLYSFYMIYKESTGKAIVHFVEMFDYISRSVLTVHSIFHCFICYFLSSQYREAARQLVCIGRKAKTEFIGPGASSVVIGTKNTTEN